MSIEEIVSSSPLLQYHESMRKISITIEDATQSFPIGTSVGDALASFSLAAEMGDDYQKNPYVIALVNDKPLSFSSPLTGSGTMVPIRLFSDIGKRCYRQSLCFLLGAAAAKAFPNRVLTIGFALGDGYYFTFDDNYLVTKETFDMLKEAMDDLVVQSLPIQEIDTSLSEAKKWFGERKSAQTLSLLETNNPSTVTLYRMGSYLDTCYEPVVSNSKLLSVWQLRLYKDNGMLLRYPRSFDYTTLDTYKDNPLLFNALKKQKEESPVIKVHSIGELSKLSVGDDVVPYIRLCEESQAKQIADIADSVCEHPSAKLILIAGPSSSGKTTFAFKLCTQLQVRGKKTIKISLDNYYLTPDKVPLGLDGKPDLERLDALNLPLLQQNFRDLTAGKEVCFPTYHFIEQMTTFGKPTRLDSKTLLVVEGIHGMNPSLCASLDKDSVFRIYISAFTQVNIDQHNRISTTDNRIIRRIVRDNRTRGTSAENTLSMFPTVQRGENLYIFPYQNNANVMINSALDYELAVLAPYAEPLLKMVKPAATSVYVTARRLLDFLSLFDPISDTLVPSDSLLREFIGGSEYGVT